MSTGHLPSLCLLLRVPRGSRAAVGLSRTDLWLQWVHDWEWTAFYYFMIFHVFFDSEECFDLKRCHWRQIRPEANCYTPETAKPTRWDSTWRKTAPSSDKLDHQHRPLVVGMTWPSSPYFSIFNHPWPNSFPNINGRLISNNWFRTWNMQSSSILIRISPWIFYDIFRKGIHKNPMVDLLRFSHAVFPFLRQLRSIYLAKELSKTASRYFTILAENASKTTCTL